VAFRVHKLLNLCTHTQVHYQPYIYELKNLMDMILLEQHRTWCRFAGYEGSIDLDSYLEL